MKMKKIFSLLLVATMTMAMLSACGSDSKTKTADPTKAPAETAAEPTAEPTAGPTAVAPAEAVTLTVLAGQSTTDAGIEDMIDAALAEQYPNITLEWECVDWGNDFQPKMQQYMQSGLPDIMIGKAQDVGTYAPQGILGAIDNTYAGRVLDAASENVTLDGNVYGVVYNALYQGVYYNKDMFAENGWTVPTTLDELQVIIDACKTKGIVPFASHMVDTWSIGNVTMQFAMNDVFNNDPTWGDKFRAGEVSYATSKEFQHAYQYNKLIFDNTYPETFSTEQTDCDAKMVLGEAAMKVSGSWSIQNFLDIDENFNFGIFPFPNQTGDSKLIFEPNITIMTSAASKNQEAINCVLDVLTGNKELAIEIYDYTKTAAMLKDVTPTFVNPSQEDIDVYAAAGMIVDVTIGNNQLTWGGFQEENAKDIAAWLQEDETFEEALKASDGRAAESSAN
jgi:ABC-type glycerol-3-phosphate transport system substrate-binding protein